MIPRTTQPFLLYTPASSRWPLLWWRWVAANALGELLGLGFVAALAGGLIWRFGEPRTTVAIVLFATLVILLGAGEGLLIGLAQWLAVHPFFRGLKRREWVKATTFGAVIAWGLGMIPSTLLALQETTSAAPPLQVPMQISDTVQYFMAAMMGLGLGLVLGVPQWMVLRHYVHQAAWWVGANAAAWAVGMPIVFFGAGSVPAQTSGWRLVWLLALTLLVAGAVVGAIHGCALVWLLHRYQIKTATIHTSGD